MLLLAAGPFPVSLFASALADAHTVISFVAFVVLVAVTSYAFCLALKALDPDAYRAVFGDSDQPEAVA